MVKLVEATLWGVYITTWANIFLPPINTTNQVIGLLLPTVAGPEDLSELSMARLTNPRLTDFRD